MFVKQLKRLAALVLAMALAMGFFLPAGAKTAPGQGGGAPWELNDYPIIIVHGITQSEVFLYEDDNVTKKLGADGKPIKAFPTLDINAMLPKLIWPLVGSLLLQNDIFLTKTLRGMAADLLGLLALDETGRPVQKMRVEKLHYHNGENKQPTSIADLPAEWKENAYYHIPLQEMAALVGENKVYYFAYNSFGNLGDHVEELYKLIQDILKKHGTTKVNIIPISLGGTIMNGLVESYKDKGIAQKLNNVVYTIAALDGSNLAGDLYARKVALDNKSLYRTMLPSLIEGANGYLINIALRLLPKRLLKSAVDAVIDGVVGGVASRCTMLWGLVPQADYPKAAKEWLSAPSMAEIKKQTDAYYQAQVHSRENILYLKSQGVNCFAIAEYNVPMYPFVSSALTQNSDSLLQLDSPSLGATYGYIDTPLAKTYVPKDAAHLSPDRIVDASTGILPDHTWYFKNQDHESTGRCDVIMKLTMRLACGANKNVTVHTLSDVWPQFNYGRNGRWLTNDALRRGNEVDVKTLSAEDKKEFEAAFADIKKAIDTTVIDPAVDGKIRERFTNIMIKIGKWSAPEKKSFWDTAGEKVAWFFSEAFYFAYGPRGFIDPIWAIWTH